MKLFSLSVVLFLEEYFLEYLLKIIFLENGKTNRRPITSVAKPGNINSKAANAIAAPEIIS